MKATDLDKRFDAGEDVSDQIDWLRSKRPNTEHSRVNVEFPAWVVKGLDQHAQRLGGTRQSLIKIWIADRLG
ncbi:type II toxin-antitoxin system BrnA family antitoxin [Sandarakinorhabdus sp.]|uniref:type II toxin-antitoxin system BrnA family antitoxin n=1 Tax=Sandarakinorhabdus sp. TaxID=1916663 RepID=UPI003F6EC10E